MKTKYKYVREQAEDIIKKSKRWVDVWKSLHIPPGGSRKRLRDKILGDGIDCSHVKKGVKGYGRPRAPRVELACAVCGKKFMSLVSKLNRSKHGVYFCGKEHKNLGQSMSYNLGIRPPHYGQTTDGRWSYRVKALKAYEHKCVVCGYSDDDRMLEVDHIDSNRGHNRASNLQIMCVWCHRVKTLKIRGLRRKGPTEEALRLSKPS